MKITIDETNKILTIPNGINYIKLGKTMNKLSHTWEDIREWSIQIEMYTMTLGGSSLGSCSTGYNSTMTNISVTDQNGNPIELTT